MLGPPVLADALMSGAIAGKPWVRSYCEGEGRLDHSEIAESMGAHGSPESEHWLKPPQVLGLCLLYHPAVNKGIEVHLESIAVHLIWTVALRHAR